MSSKDLINLGIAPDSGTGDSARRGGAKINMLFADLYAHLGDNPVGSDPAGTNYGYRQTFNEYEYKVGEIHAAGRYIPIKFKTTNSDATIYSAGSGWGADTTGNGIPDVYEDSEWFFLARGDSLGLDLREVDSDKSVHLVLPLAAEGDVIRVRDTFSSWDGRFINIWTTPYEFQSSTQLTEWKTATGHTDTPTGGEVSVGLFRDIEEVPYKAITGSFDAALNRTFNVTTDTLYGSTAIPTGTSPIYLKNIDGYELIFTYLGPATGWKMQANPLQNLDLTTEIQRIDDRLIEVDSDIALARARLDSDSLHLQMIRTEADSDVQVIAQLRRDADSDSRVIQRMSIQIDGGVF